MKDVTSLPPADAWPTLLPAAVEAVFAAGEEILAVYRREITVDYKADHSPLTEADRAAHRVIVACLAKTGVPLLSEEGAAVPYETRAGWRSLWVIDPLDGTKEFIKRNGEFTVNVALVHDGTPFMGVVYAPESRDLYLGIAGVGAFRAQGVNDGAAVVRACTGGRIGEPLRPLAAAPLAPGPLRVVASRSHGSVETDVFITGLERYGRTVETVSRGSSLKLCLIAAGEAHLYPRLAPTMEWDTAAAQAVVTAAGGTVVVCDAAMLAAFNERGVAALYAAQPLTYNRENLLNPWFVALHPSMRTL